MASERQRMKAIQSRLEQLGVPANMLVRRDEKWVQHRGYIKGNKFATEYEQGIDVPERHNRHPPTAFAMELFGAWLVGESRNPTQGHSGGVPVQQFDLGGEDSVLIICNSDHKPALQGLVGAWRSESDIVDSAVERQSEENNRQ